MDIEQMSFAELHAALRYHVNESFGMNEDRVIAIVQAMKVARARENQASNLKAA